MPDENNVALESEVVALRAQVEALAREVDLLRDRQAILDCLTRYSRGLDRHDDSLLASVYHPDAVDQHGDFLGPPDEFVPWANAFHAKDYVAHTHAVTNHTVEIDGDTAHSEIYWLAVLRRRDGHIDIGGGRYVDRLERRGGEWRVAARVVLVDWQGRADDVVFVQERLLTGTWDRGDVSYRRPLTVPVVDAPLLRPSAELAAERDR